MSAEPLPTILLNMPKDLPAEARESFTQALFILSQSDTGRYLLEEAKKDGYTLSAVRPEEQNNFRGQASPFPRRLRVSTALAPEIAALTLAHECAHILQFRAKMGGGPNGRFPDATRLMFAAEADALAHMAQVAVELKIGKGSGWISPKPLAEFSRDFPLSASIVDFMMKMEPESLDNGKLMTEVFKSYYQMPGLRVQYESGQIRDCESAVDAAEKNRLTGAFAKALLFVRKSPVETVTGELVRHKGKPYLKEHGRDIDFNSALFCGVSSMTKSRMVALLNRIGRKAEAAAAEREIPVHDQMNSAEESLRLWREKQKRNKP